jgi:vinculin
MQDHTDHCEDAIRSGNPIKMVEHTSALARLGNRVLQVAKQETENSEDPRFISSLNYSADQLHSSKS